MAWHYVSPLDDIAHVATKVAVFTDGRREELGDPDEPHQGANPGQAAEIAGWTVCCSCGWSSDCLQRQPDRSPADFGPLLTDWERHLWPTRTLVRLGDLTAEIEGLQRQRDRVAGFARALNLTWSQIGSAAHMSRQSAQERWSHPRHSEHVVDDAGRPWMHVRIDDLQPGDRTPLHDEDGSTPPPHRWAQFSHYVQSANSDGFDIHFADDPAVLTTGPVEAEDWFVPVYPRWL
jgi:hypothetical protein